MNHLRTAFGASRCRPGLLWFVIRWQRLTGIQLDVGLQHRLDFLQRIGVLDRHPQQWNPGCFKYLIHKLIAFLAIIALVALVVQFDPQEGTHRLGVAQQKIDMLAVDFVGVNPVLAGITGFDVKDVPQRDLAENLRRFPPPLS